MKLLVILFILIKINMQGKNKDITIHEKMRDVLSTFCHHGGELKSIDHWRPTRKIDEVMNKTEVGNGNSRNK